MHRLAIERAFVLLALSACACGGPAAPSDAGARSDAGAPERDAGRTEPDDAGEACGAALPPAGACQASTLACLETAVGTPAANACIDADPSPDACYACVDDALIYCMWEHGCDVSPYVCCVAGECADAEDVRECRRRAETGACRSLGEALVDCGTALVMSGECPLYAARCFE